MTFERPWLLPFALLAAAFGCWLLVVVLRRRSRAALRYSNLPFLIAAARPSRAPLTVLLTVWSAAMLLVAASIAGVRVNAAVPVRDGTVVFCIDTSGSMATSDVTPTRAQAALNAMRGFIDASPPGIAIGIVSFAGDAQTIAAPSRDRDRIRDALDEIPPPNGATAIGDALVLAANAMPLRGRRIVILITDGENNAGSDPSAAAAALHARAITLYTVGIGTNSGALVPGTLEQAGLDEDALRAFAAETGGAYSRATGAGELQHALATLGRTVAFEKRNVDLSQSTALAAAILAAIAFLSGAWTRSI